MKLVATIIVGIVATAHGDPIPSGPLDEPFDIFSGTGMLVQEYLGTLSFFFLYPEGNGVRTDTISFPGGEIFYRGRIERGIPGRTGIYVAFSYDWNGVAVSAEYAATESFGPDERTFSASPAPASFFIEPDGMSFSVLWQMSPTPPPVVPDDGSTTAMLSLGLVGVALRQRIFR